MSTLQKIAVASGILITLLAAWILSLNTPSDLPEPQNAFQQTPVEVSSLTDLKNYFAQYNYQWPPENISAIPNETILNFPDDLNSIKDSKLRKQLFIQSMLPIIYAEQNRIETARQTVIEKLNRTGEKAKDHQWFKQLLKDYYVKAESFAEQRNQLLNRMDTLPTTLILAQAAIESAWGTSRFAREGNSLFGEWTYNKAQGLVPDGRESGKTHRVKKFSSLQDSVRSYIKNINRNRAYAELRSIRKTMRDANKALDAYQLAEGLHRYSQKGKQYIDIVRSILDSKEFQIIEELERSRG